MVCSKQVKHRCLMHVFLSLGHERSLVQLPGQHVGHGVLYVWRAPMYPTHVQSSGPESPGCKIINEKINILEQRLDVLDAYTKGMDARFEKCMANFDRISDLKLSSIGQALKGDTGKRRS